MASDADLVDDLANEYHDKLERQRQASKVFCCCQTCSIPGVPLWERVNIIHRSKAAKHCREEREKKDLPPPQRGANAGQSFWKPEDAVTVFEHEALQTSTNVNCGSHVYPLLGTGTPFTQCFPTCLPPIVYCFMAQIQICS